MQWYETYVKIGLKWVLLEGVFYISGAALYGLRFPERLAPGSTYIDIGLFFFPFALHDVQYNI